MKEEPVSTGFFGRLRTLALAFGSMVVGVVAAAAIVIALRQSSGMLIPVIPAAFIAGLIAMTVGWRLLPAWWRPVLVLGPLGLVSLLYVNPWFYLGAAVLLGALQWNAIATRIPLYRSDASVAQTLVTEMQSKGYRRFLDLGCGDGRLLLRMAQAMPEATFSGIESAPVLYLVARWRCRSQENCRIHFGDFWKLDWSGFDLVFGFLSPEPMLKVWRKAIREMKQDGVLMSLAFEVPGIEVSRMLETPAFDLYIYQHADLQKSSSDQPE